MSVEIAQHLFKETGPSRNGEGRLIPREWLVDWENGAEMSECTVPCGNAMWSMSRVGLPKCTMHASSPRTFQIECLEEARLESMPPNSCSDCCGRWWDIAGHS